VCLPRLSVLGHRESLSSGMVVLEGSSLWRIRWVPGPFVMPIVTIFGAFSIVMRAANRSFFVAHIRCRVGYNYGILIVTNYRRWFRCASQRRGCQHQPALY